MAENVNALPPGKLLKSAERTYRIVKTLGSGGFGITYLVEAQNMENGQVTSFYYAMKEHFISRCCERNSADSKIVYSNPVREEVINSQKDFLAEAARLQQVGRRHPNIVDVCDIFEANNTAYYVMDYLHGQSLRQYVLSRGMLSPQEAVDMMSPIIDAIGFLHANRMTHLDIKPDNIMLTSAPQGGLMPVLIDFGLSKHYDESGTPTSTINTLACSDGYSPVEQYGGITTFSPTADIYSLGATMLFTLTGRDPRKSTEMTPGELNASLATIPPVLAQLIAAMMNSNRQNRPQSAGEVLAYLRQIAAPQPQPQPAGMPYGAAAGYGAPDPNATVPLGGAGMPPTPPGTPAGGQRPVAPGGGGRRPAVPAAGGNGKKKKTALFVVLGVVAAVFLGLVATALIWLFGGNIHDYDRVPSAVERYVDLTSSATSDAAAESTAQANYTGAPLQIFLMWSGDRDLDLMVHTPTGVEINRNNTENELLGAMFSGDAYGGSNCTEYAAFLTPESGHYDVFASTMSVLPENGAEVRLVVMENGTPKTYKARLQPNSEGVEYYMLASFDYEAHPAEAAEEVVEAEEAAADPATTAPADPVAEPVNPDRAITTPAPAPAPAPVPSPAPASNRWEGPFSFSSSTNSSRYYTVSGMTSGQDAAAQRRAAGLTGNGPIKISLLWDTQADLDLYVNTPGETDVYWFHRDDETTGGHHSGDDMGNGSGSFESIAFSSPTNGTYNVFVRVGTAAVGDRFKVVLKNGSSVRTVTCTVPSFTGDQRYIKVGTVSASGYHPQTGSNRWEGPFSFSSSTNSSTYYTVSGMNSGQDAAAQRRAAGLTGNGPIKISLLWDTQADLDLYVNTPGGTDVYWYSRDDATTGAHHSGDNVGTGSGSFESIAFSSPTNGTYDVFVRVGTAAVGDRFKVVLKNGSSVRTVTCTVPSFTGSHRYIKVGTVSASGYTSPQRPHQTGSQTGSNSGGGSIPATHGNASRTNYYISRSTVDEYITANVSTSHNSSLERRARNLSGSGSLRITAFWDCSGDVDLIVNTPGGDDVYFANTTDSTTGAHFSGDQMGGNGSYESIRFTNPASGLYEIFVRARSSFEEGGKVTVVINDGSSNYTYTTRIYPHGNTRDYKITGFSR